MNNWEKDLKAGAQAELEIADILISRGNKVVMNNSKDYEQLKKWDMTVTNNKGITYNLEVKWDKMASTTGNICVEWNCLNHSEADLYVYKVDNEFYIFTIKQLKSFISKELYKMSLWGGDKENSFLYLFDKNWLLKQAKKIN